MLRMISDAVPTMTNRSKPECHPGHPMLLETCSGMCPAEKEPEWDARNRSPTSNCDNSVNFH